MRKTKSKRSAQAGSKKPAPHEEFIGRLNGIFKVVGDIESPLEGWEILRESDEYKRPDKKSGRSRIKPQS
jgi:hypothetical protein